MAIQILMPTLSPTMEEGTLTKWFVKEGDKVESGDILAEIETDKATMEFEAVDEGIIGKILVPEGTKNIKVNTAIVILLEEGEDSSSIKDAPSPITTVTPSENSTKTISNPAPSISLPAKEGKRVFASPLARRIAASKGIDLASISGSGPKGRIVKSDLETAIVSGAPKTTPLVTSPSSDQIKAIYKEREFEEIPLDGMRKVIASRLSESKQTIPHFYLRRSINIDRLLATRSELNDGLADSGVKISINDFIIKACAKALQDIPDANVVWANDRILKFTASDVAVAVSVEGGLFTPVLKDSERKSLSELTKEMKDLASRARDKKLAPHEYQGGSFAISNLGMMGIENFDAVINPPHGSILAVGAGIKKPIIGADGSITVATIMSVTLSVDHRAIDGALGAEFLAAITKYLENPLILFV